MTFGPGLAVMRCLAKRCTRDGQQCLVKRKDPLLPLWNRNGYPTKEMHFRPRSRRR
jgi:hypothetical protein